MWIDLIDFAWAIATCVVFVSMAFVTGYAIGHFVGGNEEE